MFPPIHWPLPPAVSHLTTIPDKAPGQRPQNKAPVTEVWCTVLVTKDSAAKASLHFAPATQADVAAMHHLARAAYGIYAERMGKEPAPMAVDYGKAPGDALLVWRGAELVGMLITRQEADALLIDNVAVSPNAQGLGLGSGLLVRAEEQARAAGLEEIRLYTNQAMTENLRYYLRRGFVETHRAEQDGFQRVFFTKTLRHS